MEVDFIYPDGTVGWTVPCIPTPVPGLVIATSPQTGKVHIMHQPSGGSLAQFPDAELAAEFILTFVIPESDGIDWTGEVHALNDHLQATGFVERLHVAHRARGYERSSGLDDLVMPG